MVVVVVFIVIKNMLWSMGRNSASVTGRHCCVWQQ